MPSTTYLVKFITIYVNSNAIIPTDKMMEESYNLSDFYLGSFMDLL